MFTVKWQFDGPDKSRGEELYSTKLVSMCLDGKLRFTRDDARESSGIDVVLDIGDVYVMNEVGKTVATYYFNSAASLSATFAAALADAEKQKAA